jgi:fatty acid desaturase
LEVIGMSTRAHHGPWGVPLALSIIGAWAGHLAWALTADGLSWASPLTWLHIPLQAYLCTGLFITGHDAMHRRPDTPDMAPHHARTLPRNHLWAMLSCYFFGYHWEHHESPLTPWWALWRMKDARARVSALFPGR